MDFKEWITTAVDDLVSLEVTTLTKKGALDLSLKKLEGSDKTAFDNAYKEVEDARKKLLTILKTPPTDSDTDGSAKKGKIRAQKKVLREAERQFDATKKALGIYDPKDIFSQVRSKLMGADLVAYSRFELEGDSVSFINSDPEVQDLVAKHNELVTASQAGRKTLFETALRIIDKDK